MSTQKSGKPTRRQDFEIGIICALSLEAGMVEMIFDKRWDTEGIDYGTAPNDPNAYTIGTIAGRNVVLAYCPSMGSNSAAQVATRLISSFTAIKIVLVAGICGAVPSYQHHEQGEEEEIWLGDCIISTSVIQLDFGRAGPGTFARKDGLQALGRAPLPIGTMMTKLQTQTNRLDLNRDLVSHLQALQDKHPTRATYPGAKEDRLYRSTDIHTHQSQDALCEKCDSQLGICKKTCKDLGCEDQYIEQRTRQDNDSNTPGIHFGCFGSSSIVLKSGLERDRLAKTDGIIAFEMESAGVWDSCPTVVIKAACDYADSHKNKNWQDYAAVVAAAGLKAFIPKIHFLGNGGVSDDSTRQEQNNHSSTKPVYMVPFLRNQRFTGREQVLQEIENQLLTQRTCRQLALYGLGGVGKTQVALEFCHVVKDKYQDCSIFWVSAMSQARFKQDMIEIARKCNIGAGRQEDDIISAVQAHLSNEESGRWLLIVDNADDSSILFNDESGISESLPQSMAGMTLFTTRSKDMAVDLADGDILDLERMQLEEARLFLKRSLRRDDLVQKPKEIDCLLEELTYLPLAIVQASSYIMKNSITISKYLDLMKRTEAETIKLLTHNSRRNLKKKIKPRDAVATTWLVSFEQIRKEESSAADILFLLALCENKSIPRSILPQTDLETDLTNAIGILIGYSFLIAQNNNEELYDMHRLVHLAIRDWMQREGILEHWRGKAISRLAQLFEPFDHNTSLVRQQYIPHAIRLLQDIGHEQTPNSDIVSLCFNLSTSLEKCSRTFEALRYTADGVSWMNRDPLLATDSQLEGYSHLADIYLKNGQIKLAIEISEAAEAIAAKLLAEENSVRLHAQYTLGSAYRENGQYQQAIELLEKVITTTERLLPMEHPTRLRYERGLGITYLHSGQIKQAVSILEQVVARKAKGIPEDDVKGGIFQMSLANAYLLSGQSKKGVKMLEEVDAVYAKLLAAEHPYRLNCQNSLGTAYLITKQTKKAVEVLEKVVAVREKAIPEENPVRLRAQVMLAEAYLEDHQTGEALKLLKRAALIAANIFEPGNPKLLHIQYTLAKAYQQNGETGKVTETLYEALRINRVLE